MRRHVAVALLAATLSAAPLLGSCGLPGDGEARSVDDDVVPYRLLEPGTPTDRPGPPDAPPGRVPVVFWLAGERLVPEAADEGCAGSTTAVVDRLVTLLAAGPSDETRARGRSSAIPPDAGLGPVDVADGIATVPIDTESSTSADRLPVAVGQVVLTLTSAPGVESVEFTADGERVAVPLPDGALTEDAVGADDYGDLLPPRLRSPGRFGCGTG